MDISKTIRSNRGANQRRDFTGKLPPPTPTSTRPSSKRSESKRRICRSVHEGLGQCIQVVRQKLYSVLTLALEVGRSKGLLEKSIMEAYLIIFPLFCIVCGIGGFAIGWISAFKLCSKMDQVQAAAPVEKIVEKVIITPPPATPVRAPNEPPKSAVMHYPSPAEVRKQKEREVELLYFQSSQGPRQKGSFDPNGGVYAPPVE